MHTHRKKCSLMCKHHIFELFLEKVFIEVKLYPMIGPDIFLFKRFQHAWEKLIKSNYPRRFSIPILNILENDTDKIIL